MRSSPKAGITAKRFGQLEGTLLRLHSANDTEALWSALIDLLGQAYSNHSIVAGLCILGYGPSVMLASRPMPLRTPEWLEKNYVEHPGLGWLKKNPGAKLVSVTDVMPAAELKRSDYYRLYMQPEGWLYSLAFFYWKDQWLDSFVGINREESQGDFTPEDRALAARLYPQIGTAIRRVAASQATRESAGALADYLHDLPMPSVRVDWRLRVVYANRAAMKCVGRWETLRTVKTRLPKKNGSLRLPAEILTACVEMKQEYQTLSRANSPRPASPSRIIEHPTDRTFRAFLRPLNFKEDALLKPSFWIHWESPQIGNSETHLNLSHLRTLTPRERELAVLVCEGCSNAESAKAMGTGLRTIESQLSSIFSKLKISRRTQLISKLRTA